MPARTPLPLCNKSFFCWLTCLFFGFSGHAQKGDVFLPAPPDLKTSRWGFEVLFSKHSTKPWNNFYGIWSDFYSNRLQLNADSSFVFFHNRPEEFGAIIGHWARIVDTFYFVPVTNTEVNATVTRAPAKLAFYRNKLFRIDRMGRLIVLKRPASVVYTKRTQDRYWYFWNKRDSRNYFYDTGFAVRSNLQHVKFGFGVQAGLQPVSGYTGAGWGGMVFSSRYIFERRKSNYLSVGTPVMLGFTVLDLPPDIHLGLAVELPVIFNYNKQFSCAKSKLHGEYFFGGGFAYRFSNFTVSDHDATIERTDNGFGPMFNTGFRWSTGRYKIRNVEVRLSYLKMLNQNHSNVFGIGVIRNF